MQKKLHSITGTPDITAAVAETRISAVIGQFTASAQSLTQQRDQKSDDDTPGGTVPPDAIVLILTPTATP